ncbi:MAG: hypothetical protein Q8P81_03350, partial [Nanoarchaeota archaeon]|nr:hypothetical protein [Nanoarchaeota archaeon]
MKKIALCLSLSIFSCDYVDSGEGEVFVKEFEDTGISDEPILPQEFRWDHIDLDKDGVYENYVTNIKDQIGPSCVLFSVLSMLESQYKIDNRIQTDIDLSEQNILN